MAASVLEDGNIATEDDDDNVELESVRDDDDDARNIVLIPTESFDDIAAYTEASVVVEPSEATDPFCSPTTTRRPPSKEAANNDDDGATKNGDDDGNDSLDEALHTVSAAAPTTVGEEDDESGPHSSAPATESQEDNVVQRETKEEDVMHSSTKSLEHCADWHNPEWRHHRKHVFILSCAGKPIYTRHGDEDRQASLMGTMLALSQFLQHSQEKMDAIRCICAGDRKFVFLPRDHMILVAVARSHESMQSLLLQLTYVYNQIISILTYNRLAMIFNRHMNFDLRRLLSGAEKFINSLLDLMETDPCFILASVRCLPLESSVREAIGQTIAQNVKVKDLVFALMISEGQLISLVHLKNFLLHPVDLHMIFNLVTTSDVFKHAESWSPVCLPKFDSRAYLHAHISYLDESCQICLVLLSVDKDMFYTLSECKNKIQEKLMRHGYIETIHESLKKKFFRVSDVGIPGILHFLYKAKSLGQFTEPAYDTPYSSTEERERLFNLYQCIYSRMHSQQRPLKILFHVGKYEAILGWVTTGFEMYATFSPMISKSAAISGINKLLRWIKREEDRLFIVNSHTI